MTTRPAQTAPWPEGRTQIVARVLEREGLGGGYHRVRLSGPELVRHARAGQFLLIGVRDAAEPLGDPLLLRPFSFLRRDPDAGWFELFLREVGRGTALMGGWAEGAEVNALGPLGHAWPEPPADGPLHLVAGGVGMPPLFDFARELAASGQGERVTVWYGGRSAAHIHLTGAFEDLGVRLVVSTDDGSLGTAGTNVAALEAALAERAEGTVYACGPNGMLAAAARVARAHDVRCLVSLEAPMACGIGVCRGCAVPVGEGYKMVCVDGPVFDAREVYP